MAVCQRRPERPFDDGFDGGVRVRDVVEREPAARVAGRFDADADRAAGFAGFDAALARAAPPPRAGGDVFPVDVRVAPLPRPADVRVALAAGLAGRLAAALAPDGRADDDRPVVPAAGFPEAGFAGRDGALPAGLAADRAGAFDFGVALDEVLIATFEAVFATAFAAAFAGALVGAFTAAFDADLRAARAGALEAGFGAGLGRTAVLGAVLIAGLAAALGAGVEAALATGLG